ncbi:MAG: MarR family transcriptional regulator [Rhodobacteraceae bacterium]|nr:MarR family transcriptional regulator [Paracoccaceae bacterium]
MKRSDISLVALRRILRATEIYGRELAKAAGLTAVQVRVLQIIAETGHSTPKAISSRMGVSQATMTTLIDRLVAKGLVDRRRSEADRRQMDILITPEGRAAVARAPDPLQDRYVAAFDALPDWEQAMIVAALERVGSLLDAGHLDAAPVLDLGDIGKPSPSR